MPSGVSQAKMGCNSFPDKSHAITELSKFRHVIGKSIRVHGCRGDSRTPAFCMLLPP